MCSRPCSKPVVTITLIALAVSAAALTNACQKNDEARDVQGYAQAAPGQGSGKCVGSIEGIKLGSGGWPADANDLKAACSLSEAIPFTVYYGDCGTIAGGEICATARHKGSVHNCTYQVCVNKDACGSTKVCGSMLHELEHVRQFERECNVYCASQKPAGINFKQCMNCYSAWCRNETEAQASGEELRDCDDYNSCVMLSGYCKNIYRGIKTYEGVNLADYQFCFDAAAFGSNGPNCLKPTGGAMTDCPNVPSSCKEHENAPDNCKAHSFCDAGYIPGSDATWHVKGACNCEPKLNVNTKQACTAACAKMACEVSVWNSSSDYPSPCLCYKCKP